MNALKRWGLTKNGVNDLLISIEQDKAAHSKNRVGRFCLPGYLGVSLYPNTT